MSKNYILYNLFYWLNPYLVKKLTTDELEYVIIMSHVYSMKYRLVANEVKRRYDLKIKEKTNE